MGKFNYTTSITGHRSVSVRRAIYQRSSPKDCCERPQYRMGRPILTPGHKSSGKGYSSFKDVVKFIMN
jgi:hypothetical protein